MNVATMRGMDIDSVQAFVGRVNGQDLPTILAAVKALVCGAQELQWYGPDYENFKGNEVENVRSFALQLEDAIYFMADSLQINIDQQLQASGA